MLRTWDTHYQPDFSSATPVYLQIAELLTADIRRGRLPAGTPLPGSRELARQLGVNRKTVVQAYAELLAQGWLESQRTRGTFVSAELPVGTPAAFGPASPTLGKVPTNQGFRWQDPTEPDGLALPPVAGFLAFNDGTPDARLAPLAALATAYRRVLQAQGRRNRLGYDSPLGSLRLREALTRMLNHDRGLNTTPDGICLTRGTQMGLYLAARLLLRPGDVVAVENPGYPPARQTFRLVGAEPVPVAVDAEGLRVDELAALCARRPVRALYLTPHHQYPTTVTLKATRRLQLLAVAARYGVVIIEDDYDHDFHYRYQPMLPLASADAHGMVVYLGSLSKLLAPALRVGYVSGPPALVAALARLRRLIDHQGDTVLEQALAELMEEGELKRHTRRAHAEYRLRRDALAAGLRQHLSAEVSFQLPEGGLAIWARFWPATNLGRVAEHLAARKVLVTPGHHFFEGTPAANALRLGFAALTPAEIAHGVEQLGQAVRAVG